MPTGREFYSEFLKLRNTPEWDLLSEDQQKELTNKGKAILAEFQKREFAPEFNEAQALAETEKQFRDINRSKQSVLERFITNPIQKGLARVGTAGQNLTAFGLDVVGADETAENLRQRAAGQSEVIEQTLPGLGKDFSEMSLGDIPEFAVSTILENAPLMLGTAGAGKALAGTWLAGLMPQTGILSKVVTPYTAATYGVMSLPEMYSSVKESGGGPLTAAAFAVPHALIENLSGLTPARVSSWFDKTKLAKLSGQGLKKYIFNALKSGLGEGSEEVAQGLTEIAAQQFASQPYGEAIEGFLSEVKKPEVRNQLLTEFAGGAIFGLAGGGMEAIQSRIANIEVDINSGNVSPAEAQALAREKLELKQHLQEQIQGLQERRSALESVITDRVSEPLPLGLPAPQAPAGVLPLPEGMESTIGTMEDYQQYKAGTAESPLAGRSISQLGTRLFEIYGRPDTDPEKQAIKAELERRGIAQPAEPMTYPEGPEGDALRSLDLAEVTPEQAQIAEGTFELPMLEFKSDKTYLPGGEEITTPPKRETPKQIGFEGRAVLPDGSIVRDSEGKDVLTLKSGKPFTSEKSAKAYRSKNNLQETHEVVPVRGGFVVMSKASKQRPIRVGTEKLEPTGGVKIVDKSGRIPGTRMRISGTGDASRIEKRLTQDVNKNLKKDDQLVSIDELSERIKSVESQREKLIEKSLRTNNVETMNKLQEQIAKLTKRQDSLWGRRAALIKARKEDVNGTVEPEIYTKEKKQWFIDADNIPVFTTKSDAMGYRGPYSRQEIKDLTEVDPTTLTEKNYGKEATIARRKIVERKNIPSTTKITPKGEAAKIEDFGEKLGGAKKDQAARLKKEYSDDELASQSLSKIWPKDIVDKTEDKLKAAILTATRDTVPAKPRKGYKVRSWVEKVKSVLNIAKQVDSIGSDQLLEKMLSSSLSGVRSIAKKVMLLNGISREHWNRIGSVNEYPNAYTYGKEGNKIFKPHVSVQIDKSTRDFKGKELTPEVIKQVEEVLDDVPVQKGKMKFEVRGGPVKGYAINKKGDPLYRELKIFKTAKEAFQFIRENNADLVSEWEKIKARQNVKEKDVRRSQNRPRTGKDHRGGKDVTSEEFANTFGFRGIEFGNWVSQGKNAKERQGMLNSAFDALKDLADILNIPDKAISLNGALGIGFGSRGSGSASAHFEPGKFIINLTKTKGAGSLAHEWFHALDRYFQKKRNIPASPLPGIKGDLYITYRPEPLYIHKEYGSRGGGITARRLQEYRKRHPDSGYWKKENWILDPAHPKGVRTEVEKAFAELVHKLDESPMTKRAELIDKGKSNGYWSRIIERAARSFENFIVAEMENQGYKNDYLANVVNEDEFIRDRDRYPFLFEGEIAPVQKAFNDLFKTIKSRKTDKGIELYSAEYLVAKYGAKAAKKGLDLFKKGIRKFSDWAREMAKSFGKKIHKTLRSMFADLRRLFKDRRGAVGNLKRKFTSPGIRIYSQMRETLAKPGMLPKKADPQKMIKAIQNHVGKFKQQELAEIGLIDHLRKFKQPVTRQDVIDFIESNQIEILETTNVPTYKVYLTSGQESEFSSLEDACKAIEEEEKWVEENYSFEENDKEIVAYEIEAQHELFRAFLNENGKWEKEQPAWIQDDNVIYDSKDEAMAEAEEAIEASKEIWLNEISEPSLSGSGTKYSEYVLPETDNYKEILLKLPAKAKKENINKVVSTVFGVDSAGQEDYALEAYEEEGLNGLKNHMDSSADGMEIYLTPKELKAVTYEALEELLNISESDSLNKQIRKDLESIEPPVLPETYESPHWEGEENVLVHLRLSEVKDINDQKVLVVEEIQSDWHQEGRKKGYTGKQSEPTTTSVPDAPFKKTDKWLMLGVKRVIQEAVDNGYKIIAWTPGSIQVDRYSLEKHVSKLVYDTNDKSLVAYGHGGDPAISRTVPENELASFIGKETAEKLLNAPTNADGEKHLSDQELKVGGEGMKEFYDKIMPAEIQKYIKKFGGKIKFTEIQPNLKLPSFDVTPGIKKASLEGQPLYTVEYLVAKYTAKGFNQAAKAVNAAVRLIRSGVTNFAKWAREMSKTFGKAIHKHLRSMFNDLKTVLMSRRGGIIRPVKILERTQKADRALRSADLKWSKPDTKTATLNFIDPITGKPSELATVRKGKLGTLSNVWIQDGTTRGFVSLPAARSALKNEIYANLKKAERGTDLFRDTTSARFEEYRSQQAKKRAEYEASQKKPETLNEKVDYFMDLVRQKLSDKRIKLRRVKEAIEKQRGQALEDFANPYQRFDVMDGRIQERRQDFLDEHMEPLKKFLAANKITYKEFNDFTKAMHAEERNEYIWSINENFRAQNIPGSGMTAERADEIKAALFAKHGKATLMRAGNMFWKMNTELLKKKVEYGLMSEEARKIIEAKYKYYTPLKRIPDKSSGFDYRATGRTSEADDNMAFVSAAIDTAFRWGEQNRVKQAFANMFAENPMPELVEISKPKLKQVFDERTGEVKLDLDRFSNRENIVHAKFAGEDVALEVKDESLLLAMKPDSGKLGAGLRFARMFSKTLSMTATQLNPDFILTNIIRDVQLAAANAGVMNSQEMASDIVKSIFKAAKTSRDYHNGIKNADTALYKKFLREGGTTGFSEAYRVEEYAKNLEKEIRELSENKPWFKTKQGVKKVGEFISKWNDIAESATRFSSFMAAKKQGWSDEKAAAFSKNISVNFNKSGEWGTTINALWAFGNAALQGSFLTARLMKSLAKTNKGRAYLGAMVALGSLMDVLNRLLSDRDDEEGLSFYEKMPDYIKDNNYVVMIPGGGERHIKIPMPYGLNVLPALGRNVSSYMFGDQTFRESATNMVESVLNAFSPIGGSMERSVVGSLAPTIVQGPLDIALNETFTGKKIKPDQPVFGAELAQSELYYSNTNQALVEAMKWLNKASGGTKYKQERGWLDFSPADIQYLFESYTSGVGKTIGRSIDTAGRLASGKKVAAENIPVVRRFYGGVRDYNVGDEFSEHAQSVKMLQDAKRKRRTDWIRDRRHLLKIEKALKDARKKIDAVEGSSLSEKKKKEHILSIKKRFNKFARETKQKNLSKNR